MSPTTTRGALLRRAGTLLVTTTLVAGPATTALAEPSPSPTPSASAGATASASPSPSPSPSPSATAATSRTAPAPSAPAEPTSPASPSASSASSESASTPARPLAPASPSTSPTRPAAGLVEGGRTTSFGPEAAAGPTTSTDATLVGAHYLGQQLAAGGHHFSVSVDGVDYPDHGVTADAVLALDAAGTGQAEAAKATKWLTGQVVDYLGFGDPNEVSAGSAAKLLNVAIAQGIDPRAFGTFDLLATVQALEQPSGRFTDKTTYKDNSNTFGQAFALLGLHRAGASVSPKSTAYLLAQQCPGGGFQLYLSDAGCTKDASADPDATAMAVQALIAVGGAPAMAGKGLDYLTTRQAASGGVGGGGPTSGVNANSTGLAGQAFVAGGRTAQARAAARFLTGLQYGCSFPAALRGGIAYDADAFAAAKTADTQATPQDQDRRSTSQALLALAGTPLATVTAAGADAVAPSLACAAPTSSRPPTAKPSISSPAVTQGAAGNGSSGAPGDVVTGGAGAAAGPTGPLAQTGTDLLLPGGIGLLLVLAGVVAVLGSRRRGVHA